MAFFLLNFTFSFIQSVNVGVYACPLRNNLLLFIFFCFCNILRLLLLLLTCSAFSEKKKPFNVWQQNAMIANDEFNVIGNCELVLNEHTANKIYASIAYIFFFFFLVLFLLPLMLRNSIIVDQFQIANIYIQLVMPCGNKMRAINLSNSKTK